MSSQYQAHGKQVMSPAGDHYADAVDEQAARHIVACLNRPVEFRDVNPQQAGLR